MWILNKFILIKRSLKSAFYWVITSSYYFYYSSKWLLSFTDAMKRYNNNNETKGFMLLNDVCVIG